MLNPNLKEKNLEIPQKFKNWAVCVSILRFDIDEGQVIETLYP